MVRSDGREQLLETVGNGFLIAAGQFEGVRLTQPHLKHGRSCTDTRQAQLADPIERRSRPSSSHLSGELARNSRRRQLQRLPDTG